MQWANSVQLLVRLQQAILQPCASYGCEVWATADAAIVPLRELQSLQHSFLRRACRVKSSIPIEGRLSGAFCDPMARLLVASGSQILEINGAS